MNQVLETIFCEMRCDKALRENLISLAGSWKLKAKQLLEQSVTEKPLNYLDGRAFIKACFDEFFMESHCFHGQIEEMVQSGPSVVAVRVSAVVLHAKLNIHKSVAVLKKQMIDDLRMEAQ